MPFNGAGVFAVYTPGNPVVTGTTIATSWGNNSLDDFATGLSTCILKDGTQTATARIPFAAGISSTLVTDATSITTGSIITAGGISTQKALWVGGLANIAGGASVKAMLTVGTGSGTSQGWIAGNFASGQSGIWATNVTPSTTNYTLQAGNGTAILNAQSGEAVQLRVADTLVLQVNAAGISIPATSNLYLDGGTDTYFEEVSDNVIRAVCGASEAIRFSASATTLAGSLAFTAGTLFSAGVTGFSNRSSDTTLYLQMPASGMAITDNGLNTKVTISAGGVVGMLGLYPGATQTAAALVSQASSGAGTTTTYIGNQAITTSSDVRLKENIIDSKRDALGIVNALRVVDHTWNDPSDVSENNRNSRGVWMGLIAQEAVKHIPWLVNQPATDENEDGTPNYWHMDYGYAIPLLVKAIQELSEKVQANEN